MEPNNKKYTGKKTFGRRETLITAGLIVLLFGLLQLLTPRIENTSAKVKTSIPVELNAVLERSCYNCHSDHAELKWYDKVAPISWIVNKDIARAREVMNFSQWDSLPTAVQKVKLWAMLNMVKAGKMPLGHYTAVHPEGKLTESEISLLQNYIVSLYDDSIIRDSIRKKEADTAFEQWKVLQNRLTGIPISPNGIPYSDKYKDWSVITMSTFPDNSMRITYGNPIAVKAIREENFYPWPDGSAVVKAVWEQVEASDGEIRPGKFVNVQFMVKDAEKFRETEGWGFAKFSTQELTPYGKEASFATTSCISCHRQLAEETGYLFNVPPKISFSDTPVLGSSDLPEYSTKAGNTERIIFDSKGLRVITTSINKNSKTMSILYGNASAYTAALHGKGSYTGTEKYVYIVWSYTQSPHWIGSDINQKILSVEQIAIQKGYDNVMHYNYKNSQDKNSTEKHDGIQERIAYILKQKPSVQP